MLGAECYTGHRLVDSEPTEVLQTWFLFSDNFKKSVENRTKDCMFIDLTKAFDTLSRKGFWLIIERLGFPSVPQYDHPAAWRPARLSKVDHDLSKLFPLVNCVKQGCVLIQTLFSIIFSLMLKQAMKDLDNEDGVYTLSFRQQSIQLYKVAGLHEVLWADLVFANNAAQIFSLETWKSSPTCISKSITFLTSLLETELDRSHVHILWLRNHFKCQDWQRKTTDWPNQTRLLANCTRVWKNKPEEGHQDQRVLSCHTHHPNVRLKHG